MPRVQLSFLQSGKGSVVDKLVQQIQEVVELWMVDQFAATWLFNQPKATADTQDHQHPNQSGCDPELARLADRHRP